MKKPPKHEKPVKPLIWKTMREPMPNLSQENLILAHLKRTNPEAYKLLKRWY